MITGTLTSSRKKIWENLKSDIMKLPEGTSPQGILAEYRDKYNFETYYYFTSEGMKIGYTLLREECKEQFNEGKK